MGIKMEKGNSLPESNLHGEIPSVCKMKRKFPSRVGKSGYSLWETGISLKVESAH
jgi:hypothetical protein